MASAVVSWASLKACPSVSHPGKTGTETLYSPAGLRSMSIFVQESPAGYLQVKLKESDIPVKRE
jgi:hypothetical protein